jgi:hypothetical protein
MEKIKIHILLSRNFFSENRAVYDIMSKYMVDREWLQMTVLLHDAC